MTLLGRLLQALPLYFDRDPANTVALSVVPDASTAWMTVLNRTLAIRVTGGTAQNVSLALGSYTLQTLATALTAAGHVTTVVAEDPSRSALCLTEVETPWDLVANSQVFAFTSLLWVILTPLAWALEDLVTQIRAGLAQMSLKTALGAWVDLWGTEYYGGVYRLFGEADRDYAERIIEEVLRWRLNARAIEQIVFDELGVTARFTNLHDRAWVVGKTAFGFLVGRKYARTTFEVALDGVFSDLSRLVERNRAAGTLAFLRFTPRSEIQLHERLTVIGEIAPRSPMPVAVASGMAGSYLLPLQSGVLSPSGALFTLGGTSVLGGPDFLGGGTAGMGIADAWSNPA